MNALEQFIHAGMEPYYRNEWIDVGELSIYLRKIHIISEDHRLLNALVIANMIIPQKYRGKGLFTRNFRKIKKYATEAGFDCIAFERVINARLVKRLERQKYTQYGCKLSKHYYKLLH